MVRRLQAHRSGRLTALGLIAVLALLLAGCGAGTSEAEVGPDYATSQARNDLYAPVFDAGSRAILADVMSGKWGPMGRFSLGPDHTPLPDGYEGWGAISTPPDQDVSVSAYVYLLAGGGIDLNRGILAFGADAGEDYREFFVRSAIGDGVWIAALSESDNAADGIRATDVGQGAQTPLTNVVGKIYYAHTPQEIHRLDLETVEAMKRSVTALLGRSDWVPAG
ncbi:hypothetical protein JNJ66_02675 [Candidatus Saccharibacteria bacterium]|nr:hypothetical protein [Candidatus Saccharibacteria bacterium]